MLEELEPLIASPIAYATAAVLGLLWGSFANVCIYRWPPSDAFPHGRSVISPSSRCAACATPIRWYDNLPIAGWLWLRGRCRACGAAFSARYVLVEALTAALFAAAWWATTAHAPAELRGLFHAEPVDVRLIRFAIAAAFCLVMVIITFIDLDHKLILNKVTVPSLVAFYALGLLLPERTWFDGIAGAAVGYGVPWAIGEIYFRLTGREGLGLGDSMLLAVVGALLGWVGVVAALCLGAWLGVVIVAGGLALRRRKVAPAPTTDAAPSALRAEVPFGPFLALAAIFYLFAEPWIQLHFRFPGG